MTLRTFGSAALLAAALAASACNLEPAELSSESSPSTSSPVDQELTSTNKVLILGSSVAGGLQSREALAVAQLAPTYQLDVVTPEQWKAMTAQEFMAYRTIIIGDAACQSGTDAFEAAIYNRRNWGAIIDGNVALLATNPTTNGSNQLVTNAIRYVLATRAKRTGIYIALGCAYQDAPANTDVSLLEPLGDFKIQGVPGCAATGHMFGMYNPYMSQGLTDGMLAGTGGCVARSVFTSYPDRTFTYAAIATSPNGPPLPGQQLYTDYAVNSSGPTSFPGAPYILVRGASTQSAGCGTPYIFSGEECDLGDGLNGAPATSNQQPKDTCSFSCHWNWCGDGVVDAAFGEECDTGVSNGRTSDSTGAIGTCTSFCKIPNIFEPVPSQSPVALCQNVTAVAESTCGATASIDHGSYDPDNDLVGCTQSPAGPFNLGTTTVTLTCTDHANNSSSCTGTVTVVDNSPPTLALNGPASQSLECGTPYADPGATASDVCSGDLTASIVKTGSVNSAAPGSYSLSYSVADGSGNSASASRTVTVRDTLAPQLRVLEGPSTIQCNGAAYVDPGATASDACAGTLTSRIITSSNLDQTRAGQYTISYSATDNAGNTATATRPITVAGPCTSCIEVHLNDYNLFLEGSYTGGHDVVGKVAAGGDISMTDFAVGSGLPASDTANVLVAGGNLTLNRGAVYGDARYSASYSTNPSVVFPRGSAAQGTPINFAARFSELRSVSARLAALPANGTTKRESWGGVMLTGTNTNVNVFDVPASSFTGMVLLSINVPSGSFVVLNIRGASATFQGGGHSFSGVDQHNILYNFVDTTTINATGFGFWGTVLAPNANVTFTNGSFDGGMYAKSLNGNAEGHINTLNDRTICP